MNKQMIRYVLGLVLLIEGALLLLPLAVALLYRETTWKHFGLTGFKFIGEQMRLFERDHTYSFQFGMEESYGCLVGTHARDKDAVVAVMALCRRSRRRLPLRAPGQ